MSLAAYTPEKLAEAAAEAEANPSTAAMAMLDRLKQQLASGPMAGGYSEGRGAYSLKCGIGVLCLELIGKS